MTWAPRPLPPIPRTPRSLTQAPCPLPPVLCSPCFMMLPDNHLLFLSFQPWIKLPEKSSGEGCSETKMWVLGCLLLLGCCGFSAPQWAELGNTWLFGKPRDGEE